MSISEQNLLLETTFVLFGDCTSYLIMKFQGS